MVPGMERFERVSSGDVGVAIREQVAKVEPYCAKGSVCAVEDKQVLDHMLQAWEAYKQGKKKECIEHFGASVQYDSGMQMHPRCDLGFYAFLMDTCRAPEGLGADATTAAAATAYLIVTGHTAMGLSDEAAGAKVDALAEQYRDNWYIQYAQATWAALRQDQRKAAEALTRSILAGGPCGMYYTRGRVFSYLEKTQQSARDFAKFLELAPPEHRSRPDAHYALALSAAMQRDAAAARREYAAGEAAERKVAKYVGYQPSEVKMTAQLFLSMGL